jgi:beta-phosphoglucomutase family hydrolase
VTIPRDAPEQAFIFDLDGTLADTMPVHFEMWKVVAAKYGLTFPETLFYELGGVPTAKIAALLIERAGLAHDPVAVALEKEQAYVEALARGELAVKPIEPVVAIARALHERGAGPLAIASGSSRRVVANALAALGIADWFRAVVAHEDTVRHKPEPDVFLEAARRLGVAPATCTVYEDTDLGLEAARRAGMKGIDVRIIIAEARRGAETVTTS